MHTHPHSCSNAHSLTPIPLSLSEQYRTKFLGEQAVRAEFPEAIIVKPATLFGHEDRCVRARACVAAARVCVWRLCVCACLVGGCMREIGTHVNARKNKNKGDCVGCWSAHFTTIVSWFTQSRAHTRTHTYTQIPELARGDRNEAIPWSSHARRRSRACAASVCGRRS